MTPLMTSIANSTAQMFDSVALFAAAIAVFAVRPSEPARKPRATGPVNQHTLSDIGVEAGSITWMK